MIKFLVVVVLVAIIAISAVDIVDNNRSINYGGYNSFSSSPFLTLTANITDKSPQANFKYGYASPNLWGFARGEGNTTMTFYTNSSVKFDANLFPSGGGLNIFAYPSVHYDYGLPMSLNTVYQDKLSSYVYFDVKKNDNYWNDFAYDMFLGQGNTLQDEVEIMLEDNLGTVNPPNGSVGSPALTFELPLKVNGVEQNVNWTLNIGTSASGPFPAYVFISSMKTTNSMTFSINIWQYLQALQSRSYITPYEYLLRLGIGSEFSGGIPSKDTGMATYSFWLYSYFIINGTDYQIVHPAGNTAMPVDPPILEAKP